MNHCVIAPPTFYGSEMISDRPYHMLLAHMMLKDAKYADTALNIVKKPGVYVILDNGVWEKEPVSLVDLIDIAKQLRPSELILPDVFRDMSNSLRATMNSIPAVMEALPGMILGGVVQGNNVAELVYSYSRLANHPCIDVIHIPKVIEWTWPYRGRLGFIRHLHWARYLSRKPHHLLGIMENPLELAGFEEFGDRIRSCDSALAVTAALEHTMIDFACGFVGPKPKRQSNYFDTEVGFVSDEQFQILEHNITVIDAIVGSNDDSRLSRIPKVQRAG